MGTIDKVRGKSDEYEDAPQSKLACSFTLEYKTPLSMV
jgi:hypothetical protein